MTRLLQKPLKLFALYALFVLASSIPVYYYIVNSIWNAELDEHNQLTAEFARIKLKNINLTDKELDHFLFLWNTLRPGILVEPIT